ncbi:MAG: hypothetical protein LBP37_05550 [Spirochaetaceae bacterium]|jgi:hypothetical protein|nr:hypothetical protein [Spirochaetaceae bacterium]
MMKAGAVKAEKKKIDRRKIIDVLTVILCLGGSVLAFFLFWRNLNAALTKQNEVPVAIISLKRNTAQRRFGERLAWDLLKRDSALYSGDVIHTAALAEATIFFSDDNASVSMNENSLAQIFVSKEEKRIELSSGAVSVISGDRGAKLLLVSSGTEIDVNSGAIVSANSGSGGAGVQVVKGTANITTADGRIEAGEGASMMINDEGRALTSAAVSLLKPVPSAHYLLDGGDEMPVNFSWETVNFEPGNFVRFEISADQRFKNVIESIDVRNAKTQVHVLKPGTYWWRAFVSDGVNTAGVPESAISNRFSIIAVKKPQTISPEANGVITYRSVPPSVRFHWTADNDDVREYLLQVADNPQFLDPALLTAARGDSYTYGGLTEGKWYWQVRPVFPESWEGASSASFSAFSDIAEFSIRKTDSMLSAPVLRLPAEAAFVDIGRDAGNILFSWKDESEAEKYTMEIADNMDFRNPLFISTFEANSRLLDPSQVQLKNGINFWRVSYTDGAGNSSPPSGIRYFTAVETRVVFESVYPPDNYSVNGAAFGSLRFQWKSNLETPSRFQFTGDGSFSTLLIDELTPETEFQARRRLGQIAEGNYFWRVTNSFNGQELESAVRRLTVGNSPRIALEAPEDNAVIGGLDALQGQTIVRWSFGEPLLNSRLRVFRDGETVFEQVNPGRTVSLPPLKDGSYTWTVYAESASGFDVSPEIPFRFTVQAIPRLRAPSGLRPVSGYIFGSNELRTASEIRFTWNPVQGANAYTFRLYRENDKARASPVISSAPLRSPAYALSDLSILDIGTMVWQVEALFTSPTGSVERRGIPSESRFSIDISLPNAPVLPDEEIYARPFP